MKRDPEKVIVYRSRSEQMQDDYLWGEGLFTPLGATDILLILFVVAIVIIGYSRFSTRRR